MLDRTSVRIIVKLIKNLFPFAKASFYFDVHVMLLLYITYVGDIKNYLLYCINFVKIHVVYTFLD